jgi:hypothetical protein
VRDLLCWFFFLLCGGLLFACASAPYRTDLQLNPEAGKPSLNSQDLDDRYNTAIATGLDLGYRVVSSSAEQRMVTLNRLRSTDLVSETLEVSVESKGPAANVSIAYQGPKPLQDSTVREFTDRFLAKLKAEPSAGGATVPASAPPRNGPARVESDTKPASGDQTRETYLILIKNSNIRSDPSTKSRIVTTLPRGEEVIKIDESDGWFNVRLPSGETGWVFKRLVKEIK